MTARATTQVTAAAQQLVAGFEAMGRQMQTNTRLMQAATRALDAQATSRRQATEAPPPPAAADPREVALAQRLAEAPTHNRPRRPAPGPNDELSSTEMLRAYGAISVTARGWLPGDE